MSNFTQCILLIGKSICSKDPFLILFYKDYMSQDALYKCLLGRVKLVQGERRATAGRAEYNHQKQTITLTDNPLVIQGPNSIKGSTILIYVPNQRVEVVGSRTQRVTVTINPQSAEQAAKQSKGKSKK